MAMTNVFSGAVVRCWMCGIAVILGSSAANTYGLSIRVYDPARHDRFSSGYPSSPVINTNFHADYYDFSGVGWNVTNPVQSFALISPRHFVGANHYKPGVGTTVAFQGRDGALTTFTVANVHNITNSAGEITDLIVGELDRSVLACDNITFYPILDLGAEANYTGKEILVYGKSARVGKGSISAFQDFGGDPITGGSGVNSTRSYSFAYANLTGANADCHFEGGDSGSPSFVTANGELFVVGIHTAVLTTALGNSSYDTFVPHYLDQIGSVLQQQGLQPATTAGDVFRLCYQVTPVSLDNYSISWIGHRGRVYQLEGATNLSAFTAVSGLLTANVATVTYMDSNSVDNFKFYRVRRVDSP